MIVFPTRLLGILGILNSISNLLDTKSSFYHNGRWGEMKSRSTTAEENLTHKGGVESYSWSRVCPGLSHNYGEQLFLGSWDVIPGMTWDVCDGCYVFFRLVSEPQRNSSSPNCSTKWNLSSSAWNIFPKYKYSFGKPSSHSLTSWGCHCKLSWVALLVPVDHIIPQEKEYFNLWYIHTKLGVVWYNSCRIFHRQFWETGSM